MEHYVYAILDPRKPGKFSYGDISFLFEPFYIGKGCGKRFTRHLNKSHLDATYNPIKNGKLKHIMATGFSPLEYVVVLYNNLSEAEAFEKEKNLIKEIGRIDLKTGSLSNLTDGGDGWWGAKSPFKGKTYEEIHGKELAEKLKKDKSKRFSGNRNPRFGKAGTFTGKKVSDKAKQKLSEINSKPIIQLDKSGNEVKLWKNTKEAAAYFGVGPTAISNALNSNTKIGSVRSSCGFYWKHK